MNILVIGFGNMGCRHTQSVLSRQKNDQVWVVEPDKEVYKTNLAKIGAQPSDITYLASLDEVPAGIDIAIIATTAKPRFAIVRSLLEKGIKKFLVEKVVFQSSDQFTEIIRLLEKNNAVAYCNFVNRYSPHYLAIKKRFLMDSPLSMVISGGNFGLGCNALHYVDLFEFFTGAKPQISKYDLVKSTIENKRGSSFKEFNGQIAYTTDMGDYLLISDDPTRINNHEIMVVQQGNIDLIRYQTMKHYRMYVGNLIESGDFKILPTSILTKTIIDEIESGTTALPTIQEVMDYHVDFFRIINQTLGLGSADLCPIT